MWEQGQDLTLRSRPTHLTYCIKHNALCLLARSLLCNVDSILIKNQYVTPQSVAAVEWLKH